MRRARQRLRARQSVVTYAMAAMVVGALAMALPGFSAAGPRTPKVQFWLTLLHHGDGESRLIDLGSGLEDFGGVARFKTLADELRRQATQGPRPPDQRRGKRGVLMVSAGDNILAGPIFSVSLDMGVPFLETVAMDLIGYDAVAFGNHDFDFGPDVLADFLAGYEETSPPYLGANLDFSGEPELQALVDEGRVARAVIMRERGERIGIVSVIQPDLGLVSSPRNVVVDPDVKGAAQAEVDLLGAMGVDKIVLISHLRDIGEDIALVAELSGVDVVVAGGRDEVLANPGDLLVPGDIPFGPYPILAIDRQGQEVPVVSTGGSYAYLGRLVLGFDKRGHVVRIGESSGPVRVAGGANADAVVPDPEVQARVVDPAADGVAALATNVIATSEVDLDGRRDNVRSIETNEGNLIADSLRWQADQLAASFGVASPDVALVNGGGIRNDSIIPAGDITELDTFDMLPFPNFVTVLENIPRTQFKEILENAVSRTQPVDIPGGTGRFAQISGFRFEYSGSGTAQVLNPDGTVAVAGSRIQEVVLDDGMTVVIGGVVQPGPDITVATIDFLARGGDQYPFRDAAFTLLGATYQQALARYLETALGGIVTVADYPEGGEGRILELP